MKPIHVLAGLLLFDLAAWAGIVALARWLGAFGILRTLAGLS
jgi:hypothetical protein